MKNDSLSDRLTQIRVTYCDNKTRLFAQKTGINENMLGNYCSGLRTPGKKTLEKILAAFPAINADWLLMGKGQMLSTSTPVSEGTAKEERKQSEAAEGQVAILRELLREKDERIERITAENARLRMQLQQEREKTRLLSEQTIAEHTCQ